MGWSVNVPIARKKAEGETKSNCQSLVAWKLYTKHVMLGSLPEKGRVNLRRPKTLSESWFEFGPAMENGYGGNHPSSRSPSTTPGGKSQYASCSMTFNLTPYLPMLNSIK